MTNKPLNRILYAEDEEDIRSIAQIALEDVGGFTVIYCKSGVELLEKAKEFKPDLFLLDVMMPDMDGPTTLSRLRAIPEFADIPAIFMTAKIQPNEIEDYKKIGVLDVISKPFDPMKLADNIRDAWTKMYG